MVAILRTLERFVFNLHTAAARILAHDRAYTLLQDLQMQRQIIQANPSGMILVDALAPDMPINYVNRAFEQNTGYRLDEVVGKNCRFLHRDDCDQPDLDIIRRALANQTGCTATLRNYRKDGSLFWNEIRISPLADASGKVIYFVGIQNDVTARQEAELARQLTETVYRQMFENNRAIKLVIDPNSGRIIDANTAAVDFYGWSREQLLSMRIQEINTLTPDEVYAEMQLARSQERTFFEFRHRLASGDLRDVNVFSSPVDTAEGQRLYSIIADVTDKRRAELRYRALFEQSNDAVFILDLNAKHLQVNQRAADMLGYQPEEIVGLSAHDIVAPDHIQPMESVLQRILAGEHIPPYERLFRHKDGHLVPTEINPEIVRDADGKPLHIQSVVRDITERKQAQQRELEIALERERWALLATFIRQATHEFRTPLAVISAGAYLMSRLPDAEQRQRKYRQIEDEVMQLTRLVDMLLLSSKLESGMLPSRALVDLRLVISAVCEHARSVYGAQPELDFVSDLASVPVNGDVDYLGYALRQVVDNAYQFTPAEGKISVRLRAASGAASVEVSDTGIGIAETDLPHIFETFWRHDEAHSTPGFGLGLPIVKRIVELHGGSITVDSQLGQGASVGITLPVTREL